MQLQIEKITSMILSDNRKVKVPSIQSSHTNMVFEESEKNENLINTRKAWSKKLKKNQ